MLDQANEGGTFGGLEITRRRILFTSGGLNLSTSPVRNSRETRTTGRMANFTFLRGWAKIAKIEESKPTTAQRRPKKWGAFAEDALSFKDARESVDDFESEK